MYQRRRSGQVNVSLLFLRKELRELRKNKFVLPVYLVLPPIAVILPVLFAAFSPQIVAIDQNDPAILAILRIVKNTPEFAHMGTDEAITRFFMRSLVSFYLLLPVGLSSISAAFSVVAEKQQRTLEPILATPITDFEFLIGKLLASLVPSIILTWAAAILAAIIVNWITWGKYETALLPERFWFVGVFLLAPLMGMASVLAAIRLSAKMSDPQSANQFTGLVIVPAFMILIGIFGKVLTISMSAVAIACVVVVLLVLFLLRLNLKNFQREEILTRWK
jgi:ABC-2 type transport system permease protein